MGYAFETGAQVIIYIMSDTEIDLVISSFIEEKVFLVSGQGDKLEICWAMPYERGRYIILSFHYDFNTHLKST